MSARDELTQAQRAILAAQLGDTKPASTGLLMSFGQSVRDRREHDHTTQREDWYCLNLAAYMGERAAPVLRRLLDAENELALRRRADDAERGKDTSTGTQPREGHSTPTTEHLAEPVPVSRYDVAIAPAPEEEPVLTVGAIAEDGRPVALLFDPEARRKVAAWLAPTEVGEKSSPHGADATPDPAELLAYASAFEVPRPGRLPLLVQRSYGHADRWAILDRDGHCWHRDGYWVVHFGGIADDRRRDSARFPLAEAWPLAHRIAAGETVARATARPDEPEGTSQ
ncbi:hypothetical protein [Streptomyces canus]|uniref:hypothetical protein n=1 Tax=Streptomyces canus TaxID=58343 RepID=UPI003CFADED9